MNGKIEDIKIAMLELLQEKRLKVKVDGNWLTGKDALKHNYSVLMGDRTEWTSA